MNRSVVIQKLETKAKRKIVISDIHGNLDLYLDGSLAGGNSYAGAGAGNTGALYIENFKLDIDKVFIHNKN